MVHRGKIICTEKCNTDNIKEEKFRVPQDKLQLVTQRDSVEVFKKLVLFAAFYSQRSHSRRLHPSLYLHKDVMYSVSTMFAHKILKCASLLY